MGTSDEGHDATAGWNTRVTSKRKYSTDSDDSMDSWKHLKIDNEIISPLDILLPDDRIPNQFNHIFRQLQVFNCSGVPLEHESDLKFDFDLYASNTYYKKSNPGLPIYRIIVVKDGTVPPNRGEIEQCYLQQKHRIPIILVFVNELMSMKAFLYK